MGRRGHTLIEALVTGTLFLMVLTMCGELAVRGMRIKNLTEDKNEAFRAATIALDGLNRDLLNCDAVLCQHEDGEPLVLRSTGTVIGYRYDSREKTLTRLLYQLDFDADDVTKQNLLEDPKTMATWVSDFQLSFRDPQLSYGARLVQVDLAVKTGERDDSPVLRLTTRSGLRNP